jgi:DNA-binding transcriptional LysR family regulator
MPPSIDKFLRDLDWNLLKVFDEIVRSKGVSRAAQTMSRQQPSISSALRRLESHLGATLCRRGPSGFELTDEGAILAEICEEVRGRIGQIPTRLDSVSGDLTGQIRFVLIQNLVSARFDAAIAAFSRQYPAVELLINLALWEQIESALERQEADIGVAPVGRMNETLRYDLLYREQHRPFCGRSHPLFGRSFDDPKDLGSETFVLPGIEEADGIRRYRARHGWGRKKAGESVHLEEVRRLVVAGIGIALLPEEMLEVDVRAGLLWPLMPPQADAQENIYVITNPRSARTRSVQSFLQLLTLCEEQESHLSPPRER